MNVEVIKPGDYKEFDWSGGRTTEFYISPGGENFRDRNFDYRLSSATFHDTKSVFSDYSGYRRYILPLKGSLSLNPDGKSKIWLKPYHSFTFDGAVRMESENTPDCVDFNFIVKEEFQSQLGVHFKAESFHLDKGGSLLFYGSDMGLEIYLEGLFLCGLNLSEERLILIEAEESVLDIRLKRLSSPVITCSLEAKGV